MYDLIMGLYVLISVPIGYITLTEPTPTVRKSVPRGEGRGARSDPVENNFRTAREHERTSRDQDSLSNQPPETD